MAVADRYKAGAVQLSSKQWSVIETWLMDERTPFITSLIDEDQFAAGACNSETK